MKCPYCSFTQDRVVDSREIEESAAVRRRRECERCARRFTTYERLDEIPCMVVKKDGRREKFDRQKMLTGLQHACEKRPVAMRQLEDLVGEAEVYLNEAAERERSTIRFASVYREFKDAAEFRDELEALVQSRTQAVTEAATQAVHEAVSEAVSKAIGRPKSNPAMKEPAPTL
jgi:transcriptional repressor NrdR